jgi:histidine triad (HIT) family protein
VVSVFSRIIAGDLPARFVWKDDRCVAFLSTKPIRPGHALVVPREEIDHWLDVPPALHHHLWDVAQTIGRAIHRAFSPVKVGVALVGLEVRHVHIHLVPVSNAGDLDFSKQDPDPAPSALDRAADAIRGALT